MKLKYYLRGLGAGILVTTLVLVIAYSVKYSDSQIIIKAKQLGMVEADSTSSKVGTTENSNTSSTDDSNSATTEDTTLEKDTTPETTPEQTTTEVITTQQTTTEQITTQAPIVSGETVKFTIVKGMGSESVSALLESLGVVNSAKEFNDYLIKNNYAGFIGVNNYTVKKGDSFESIAKMITNRF